MIGAVKGVGTILSVVQKMASCLQLSKSARLHSWQMCDKQTAGTCLGDGEGEVKERINHD